MQKYSCINPHISRVIMTSCMVNLYLAIRSSALLDFRNAVNIYDDGQRCFFSLCNSLCQLPTLRDLVGVQSVALIPL